MKKKEQQILTYRAPRLQANNISTPKDALESFFSSFTLEDGRNHLWELYERCILSYAREQAVHKTAADILFFYTQMEMLLEAAWLMNNRQQKKNIHSTKNRKA